MSAYSPETRIGQKTNVTDYLGFDYSTAFETTKKYCPEKEYSYHILGKFVLGLIKQKTGKEITICEIGCDDFDTVLQILKVANEDQGNLENTTISLSGIDIRESGFAKAQLNLKNFKLETGLKDIYVKTVRGNACDSNLITSFEGMKRNSCDLVTCLNTLYVDKDNDIVKFLSGLDQLMAKNSVAVMLHAHPKSPNHPHPENGCYAFRKKFGRAITHRETGGENEGSKIIDTPQIIKTTIKEKGYDYHEVKYTVRTYFPPLSEEKWSMIRNMMKPQSVLPESDIYRTNQNIKDAVELIKFTLHKSPYDIENEKEGRWEKLVNYVLDTVETDENIIDSKNKPVLFFSDEMVLQLVIKWQNGNRSELIACVEDKIVNMRKTDSDIPNEYFYIDKEFCKRLA